MKHLPKKHPKVIAFLIWSLWGPVILFTAHLVVAVQIQSIFPYLILCTILLAILIVIGRISKELEKNNNLKARIIKQFLYGFLAPILVITIAIALYSRLVSHPLQLIKYIIQLIVIVVFLYIANSFYLVIHLDRKFSVAALPVGEEQQVHDKVVVHHQGAYGSIKLMEIALIDQRNQINWLITFKEERQILDLTLKQIGEILGVTNFFKINRNQIVHKDAIRQFKAGSFGKIELSLTINGIHATVSKDRAAEFRRWISS